MTLYDGILMCMIGVLVVLGWGIYLQLDKIIDLLVDGAVGYNSHQGEQNESHRPHH